MYCERCKKEHNGEYGSGRFCCQSCANSRIFSKESIDKKKKSAIESMAVKNANKSRSKLQIQKICPICKNTFHVHECKSNQIFCSRQCFRSDTEFKYKTKASGGYREGSGRSKSGYYKGFFCGSTYELVYIIWCLDLGINIKRNFLKIQYLYNGKNHIYYPDFIIDNCIIEIKGYHTDVVDVKETATRKLGYDYKILYKEDLKEQFDYVYTTYGTRDYAILYDDSKHVNKYICANCKNEYTSSVVKPEINYCSRKCSCIGARKSK